MTHSDDIKQRITVRIILFYTSKDLIIQPIFGVKSKILSFNIIFYLTMDLTFLPIFENFISSLDLKKILYETCAAQSTVHLL